MPRYTFEAMDGQGRRVSGGLAAPSRAAVLDHIAGRGLRPVAIEETAEGTAAGAAGPGAGRVSPADVEAFTRQLSNLLTAGVPLSRALDIVAREASSAASAQWAAVRDDVTGGASLTAALSRWPRSFPAVYVAMVRAGETGGFLNVVLEQIAEFRSREDDLKGRVKAALVYPCLLAVLATGVVAFLLVFFIPRFSAIFAEFGGSLPPLTRAIMGLSRWAVRYGAFIAAAAVMAVVGARRALAGEAGRRAFERGMLGIPGVGVVTARFALVRFCRMLGTLLGAGVPLVTALNVAREAVGNRTLSDIVVRATDAVKGGAGLSAGLAGGAPLFPPAAVEMIAVAEESGRLDKELVRLAAAYETELDRRLRMLVSVIEPVMLFLMAGIVGTVVIGMLLPVFMLQELIH